MTTTNIAEANAHFAAKRWSEALIGYKQVLQDAQMRRRVDLWYNCGSAFYQLDEAATADKIADKIAKLKPDWYGGHLLKAMAQEKLSGHRDDALYAKALKMAKSTRKDQASSDKQASAPPKASEEEESTTATSESAAATSESAAEIDRQQDFLVEDDDTENTKLRRRCSTQMATVMAEIARQEQIELLRERLERENADEEAKQRRLNAEQALRLEALGRQEKIRAAKSDRAANERRERRDRKRSAERARALEDLARIERMQQNRARASRSQKLASEVSALVRASGLQRVPAAAESDLEVAVLDPVESLLSPLSALCSPSSLVAAESPDDASLFELDSSED